MPDVRVVVVDDHAPYRAAMAAVVGETPGFVVVGAAESGEQCLDLSAAADLVLMDVNLPGMGGVEAARRLTGGARGPVVFLLSTYPQAEVDVAGSGAATYIAKAAFSPDRLAAEWTASTAARS